MKTFSRSSRQVGVLIFMMAAFALSAQAAGFSNASLRGGYSFLIDRWTADVSTDQFAMVGVMNFNGAGKVNGSYTSISANVVASGPLGGTYSVSSTGSGSIDLTTGSSAQFAITLNSTVSGVAHGVQLLETNDNSNEVISGTAVLQSTTLMTYNAASLNGNFALLGNTWTDDPSLAEDGDIGVFTFDGKGHLKATVSSMFAGTLYTNTVNGTYTVSSSGTGTLTIISNNSPKFAFTLNSVTAGLAGGLQLLATNPGNGGGNYAIAGAAVKQ
ncbi:MAG TPA: hypothetical protein VL523_01910 [Terriglobia bacterium]|nr:hypothetical protein [Terriglobia bacterium]